MKYTTLGVIGHVDHGKTSLVKALTGVDTDRLKEEKERGISIVLGFAHLSFAIGELGIVDAPGHEKFIRTMISGATAIDAVLLVVDVNEGVKPQTEEHLDIAGLLGIRRGVVAVTKCDAAGPGAREYAVEELAEYLAGTFLEGAPIIQTSSVTGEGLDELRGELERILQNSSPAEDEGYAYLPIDRVFSMSGFGTIVTGTLRRGSIRTGDEIEIYPRGIRSKIRELQSHNRSTELARPGYRTAVNLRGIEKEAVHRGDIAATPASLNRTRIIDAELRLLPRTRAPLKHRQIVRVLFGTQEAIARAHLLEGEALGPGGRSVAQLRLEEEVAVLEREPFIVRTYSPMTTIGGGRILGTAARVYKRKDAAARRRLAILAEGRPEAMLLARLEEAGVRGLSLEAFCRDHRLKRDAVGPLLGKLPVVEMGHGRVAHRDAVEAASRAVVEFVEAFHTKDPTLRGAPKEQLVSAFAHRFPEDLIEFTVGRLVAEKRLAVEAGLVRRAGFDPAGALSEADRAEAEALERAYAKGGLAPPDYDAVIGADRRREKLFRYLVDRGTLACATLSARGKVASAPVAFHASAVAEAKASLKRLFPDRAPFTPSDARQGLGMSRKHLIPLLELLDAGGFTRRQGDRRVVVE